METKVSIDVPVVTQEGLEKWRTFLSDDARKNGGTAQTLLLLGEERQPVKLLCCSQINIVIFLSDFEFQLEKATFFTSDDVIRLPCGL